MSMIDDDHVSNTSGNEHFQDIVNARLSRRSFLTGGFAAAAAASRASARARRPAACAPARRVRRCAHR